MASKIKYWEIECTRHLSTLYKTRIDTRHISEKKLIEFIRVLMSKYALTDDEIMEQFKRVPFKSKKEYINITRTNTDLNEKLNICFTAQVADTCVDIWLTD